MWSGWSGDADLQFVKGQEFTLPLLFVNLKAHNAQVIYFEFFQRSHHRDTTCPALSTISAYEA